MVEQSGDLANVIQNADNDKLRKLIQQDAKKVV